MCIYKYLMIVLICGMVFIGCSESSTESDPIIDLFTEMTKIGEETQDNTKMEVYLICYIMII